MMPFVLKSDFNANLKEVSTKSISRGWVRIGERNSDETAQQFKKKCWEVRQLVDPSAFATKAKDAGLNDGSEEGPRASRL